MSWSIDPRTTLIIEQNRVQSLKGAISSADADVATQRARQAEAGKAAAELEAADARRARGSDKRANAMLRDSLRAADQEKIKLQEELFKKEQEIKQRDEMIVDWMQSNEAFKKLAKKYSKKSSEELTPELREYIIDVAEENPEKFGESNLTKKVRGLLAK